MPQQSIQISVAENLAQLAKNFKSGDPAQAATLKKEFKNQSKNDLTRVTVYLMEVIGARDAAFKQIQSENKDLKELLDLKAPGWDKENDVQSEEATGAVSPTAGSPDTVSSIAGLGTSSAEGQDGTAQA